jgi:23S rRNA pseudouridine955/2504/2580 synthase
VSEPRTFTVNEDDDGIRLDRWFKRNLPEASFNIVSRWARTGQLRLDGKKAMPGDRILAGQVIQVPPPEAVQPSSRAARRIPDPLSPEEVEAIQAMVIGETPSAYVLNKPPGLATQGGTKTSRHLDGLLDGLADERGQRPKLVHRLDKDTSGVLLVARTARSAGHFAKEFSGRAARKIYWAIVTGAPSGEDGTVDLPLAKQPGTGGEKMHVDREEGLPAKTRWRVIDRAGNRASWVELQPLTGRTHQLRAHMAAIGHPIVGDAKYGGPDAFLTGGISRKLHLHARRLKIDAPEGKIDATAELPPHFAESLAMLGFDAAAGDNLPPLASAPQQAPRKTRPPARRGERRARSAPSKGRRR